jgi:flagellar motor switch protein FliN
MATTKAAAVEAATDNLPQLDDMDVEVSIELGRHTLTLDDALTLRQHSLIELDKVVGEPVDVLLNGKLFARGEVVTVSENFGVRLTEVIGETNTDDS